MANPNIVNVTSIYGNTTYVALSTTSATTLLSNAASSGLVYKVDNIVVSNVNGSTAANVTVSVNSAASGGGTAYRLAYQISVPAGASLIVTDKSTAFYLMENQSVVITAGTANYLEAVLSYENISS
jgi:hypothetical protein